MSAAGFVGSVSWRIVALLRMAPVDVERHFVDQPIDGSAGGKFFRESRKANRAFSL